MSLDFSEALHDRMEKVMRYVAARTNDQWVRDYLLSRLEDLGCGKDRWFERDADGHFQRKEELGG